MSERIRASVLTRQSLDFVKSGRPLRPPSRSE